MSNLKPLLVANGRLLKLLRIIRSRAGSGAADADLQDIARTRPADGMGMLIMRIHDASRILSPAARRAIDQKVYEIMDSLSPDDIVNPAGGVSLAMQSHLAAAHMKYRASIPD